MWILGDGFAEVVRLPSPVINDELEVVNGDGTCDSIAQGFDLGG